MVEVEEGGGWVVGEYTELIPLQSKSRQIASNRVKSLETLHASLCLSRSVLIYHR